MRPEAISSQQDSDPNGWSAVEPMLDDAIAALSAKDRDAIILRYFQGRNISELASALGVSQDAAKQRVCRAVDRLRTYFAARGVAAPSASVALWLGSAVKPAGPGVAQGAADAAIAKIATSAAKVGVAWTAGWSKVAAAAMLATAVTASGIAMQHLASAGDPSPTTAPTTQDTEVDQAPIDLLRRLSVQLRIGNQREIEACLYNDGTNPELDALIRASALENAATYRLDQTAQSAFHQRLTLPGLSLVMIPALGGGFEALIDRSLEAPRGKEVMINGDTAIYRIPLSPEAISGTGKERIPNLARWSGASVQLNLVDGHWKLNTSRSFRIAFGPDFSATPATSPLQLAEKLTKEMVRAFNAVADGIETGQLSTPQQAVDACVEEIAHALQQTGVKTPQIMILPAEDKL